MPYYAILCHIICHIMPYYAILWHIMAYCGILWHIMPYYMPYIMVSPNFGVSPREAIQSVHLQPSWGMRGLKLSNQCFPTMTLWTEKDRKERDLGIPKYDPKSKSRKNESLLLKSYNQAISGRTAPIGFPFSNAPWNPQTQVPSLFPSQSACFEANVSRRLRWTETQILQEACVMDLDRETYFFNEREMMYKTKIWRTSLQTLYLRSCELAIKASFHHLLLLRQWGPPIACCGSGELPVPLPKTSKETKLPQCLCFLQVHQSPIVVPSLFLSFNLSSLNSTTNPCDGIHIPILVILLLSIQQGKNVNAAAWRAASLRQLVNGFLDLYPGHAIHHICIAQFRQNSLSHLRSNACHKAIQAGKMVAELLLCMVGALVISWFISPFTIIVSSINICSH